MNNADKKKVVIFGPGDFGQVVHFYLSHDSPHEIVAFTANQELIKQDQLLNLPIVPFENIENQYPPKNYSLFIAIPYTNNNKTRARIFHEAKTKGYELITYINSKAILWDNVEVGENCFILEGNVIQPFVKIGDDVILWSGNHIGHHSIINDHCFLASHVVVSGRVTIEPYCFVGVNATIRDGVHIAKECIIGAGAVILKDTNEKEVYKTKGTVLLDKKSDQLDHI